MFPPIKDIEQKQIRQWFDTYYKKVITGSANDRAWLSITFNIEGITYQLTPEWRSVKLVTAIPSKLHGLDIRHPQFFEISGYNPVVKKLQEVINTSDKFRSFQSSLLVREIERF